MVRLLAVHIDGSSCQEGKGVLPRRSYNCHVTNLSKRVVALCELRFDEVCPKRVSEYLMRLTHESGPVALSSMMVLERGLPRCSKVARVFLFLLKVG